VVLLLKFKKKLLSLNIEEELQDLVSRLRSVRDKCDLSMTAVCHLGLLKESQRNKEPFMSGTPCKSFILIAFIVFKVEF